MINQITCNSNNAIQLSRGELLQWLNTLLKLNYTKIQQLGTGAAYCQLLDLIYPGKVPLSKVNWKAKFDYQYLNNFKVLQQSFTKLNIMKHIDVQKLVKCKYQDNLQFLQWFKKIFDTTGSSVKEYDPITRRGDKVQKQKQNKGPATNYSSSDIHQISKQNSYQNSKQTTERMMTQTTSKQQMQQIITPVQNYYSPKATISQPNKLKTFKPNSQKVDEKLLNIFTQNQNEQKQFYLRKIKQIEYLMDTWDNNKKSQELIANIRNIILVTPEVQWSIEDGQFRTWEQRQQ